jgi:hypothetical protein
MEFSCEAEYLPGGTLSSGRIQLSKTLGLLFLPFAKESRPFHIEVCMYIVLGNVFSLVLHQPFFFASFCFWYNFDVEKFDATTLP